MESHSDRQKVQQRRVVASRACMGLAVLCFVLTMLLTGCGRPVAEAKEAENAGNLQRAVELYQKALADRPDDVGILQSVAVDLMLQGRFDEALVYQERAVALDPLDAQTRVELGFNYLNHQQRPLDAVRVFREAVQVAPSAKLLTFLAQGQIATEDRPGAEQSLRRAIELDPSYGHSYELLAELLREEGRQVEAEELVDQARQQGITVAS